MAALAKLFKKKHNKENNEPFLKLRDDADSAARSNSANSSIYIGDYPTLPRRSGGIDPNNPRWKSPYDVITAPQTRKPTRSCPGAPINIKSSSSSTYSGASRSRHFSPDYGRRSQHNNKYPTIFEVSGSYENYPNEAVDTYDSHNERLSKDSRSKSSKRSTQRVLAAQNSDSLRDRPTFQRHQHKRQSLNLRNVYGSGDSGQASYRKIRQRQNNAVSTSEYGSADPSPTNPVAGAVTVGSKRADYYDAQSFDNTDYEDSDSEDEGPLSIMDICEQQLQRLALERNKYKEKARNNKLKYIETCAKVEELMAELSCEKREVESLKANLHRTNVEMENFRSFINQQFRKVGGHYRQQAQQQIQQQQQVSWLQEQQSMQPPNFSIAHRERVHHLNDSVNLRAQQIIPLNAKNLNCPLISNNNEWQDMSTNNNPHALGAGEALCSRTEFFGSVNPAFTADLPTSAAPTVNSDNIQLPMLDENEDEVKIFRHPEAEDDKDSLSVSAIEDARDSSAIKILSFQCIPNQNLSPLFFSRVQDGYLDKLMNDEKDSLANVKNNDLSSANENYNQKHEFAERTIGKDDTDQSSDDSLDINDAEKYVNFRQAEPARHANLLAGRRSFSETDLDKLCVQRIDDNDNSFVINLDDAIEVNEHEIEATNEHRKYVGFDCAKDGENEQRRVSKSRYCRYSPKRNADHSSSYSSDDDAIRIFARQLRKRGDLVHFRPGRKNLVNIEHKLFRCFGSGEREAIAQFDYLKDMQTDVSDLASSPTYNS